MIVNNLAKENEIKFDAKDKLERYLTGIVLRLNEDGEYNLMAHEVKYSCALRNKSKIENLELVMSHIFKEGFDVNGYPTVFGTIALMGSSMIGDVVSKMVNYDYYRSQKDKIICFFAIPKYITICGRKVEFSSFNGTSARLPDQELVIAYKNQGLMPEFHNFKCCLLDAIKGHANLPKCYNLGAIEIDTENGKYTYYNSGTHLSYQDENFKLHHARAIEEKAVSLFKKYGTTDLKKVIIGEYKKDIAWLNEQLDFDI